ncbi:hypothetical protein HDV06_004838 [Boothiomyces sp. JEL0866]|nr:hypothetical protein HDV06_004838 [Boothiomyces sp. JEL0866]
MNNSDVEIMITEEKRQEAKQFTWENVSFGVQVNKKEKMLLSNISGQVNAGEIIAIMGGSGAGKTTLLNVLAGRIGPGSLSGNILLDGEQRSPATWALQCAYVEQDDILFKKLTVFETLRYSALLRLPSKMSVAEKESRVNEVIAQLGLTECKNTQIGDEQDRGISGGERKRVAIGIELVTNPHILFLDEIQPTSGLDAFNAFNTIKTLKDLAKQENKLILMTIHQPRTDILNLFDKIMLLSIGKTMWFGSTPDAVVHFENLGYHLPPKTNPSDFFIDIITIDQRGQEQRDASLKRIEIFENAFKKIEHQTCSIPTEHSSLKNRINWPSSWLGEFYVILHRYMINMARDKSITLATLGQAIINLVLVSLLYANTSNDMAGIQNRIGVFLFLGMTLTFGNVIPIINAFPETKRLIKRERAAGSYRSTSAFFAKVVSTLPLLLVVAILLGAPLYWIIGLYNNLTNYFTFIFILFLQSFTANSMGLLIGSAVPNTSVGLIVTPMILVVFVLFSGIILNLNSAPIYLRWIQWVSFLTYTMKALTQNEFNPNAVFTCTKQPCFKDGPSVIDAYGFSSPDLWGSIAANAGLSIAFLILGAIISATTSPSMSAFTVGMGFDAHPEQGLDYSKPLQLFSIILISIYIVFSILTLYKIFMGWLSIQKSKILYFIYTLNILLFLDYIVMILRYSQFTFPLLCWTFNTLGAILLYFCVMGQLEILKAFAIASSFLTVKRIYYTQIYFTVLHLVSMGGLYLAVFTLGHQRPVYLVQWHSIGYIIFGINCISYETIVAKLFNKHISKESQSSKIFESIYILVIFGICCDWIAIVLGIINPHGTDHY